MSKHHYRLLTILLPMILAMIAWVAMLHYMGKLVGPEEPDCIKTPVAKVINDEQ